MIHNLVCNTILERTKPMIILLAICCIGVSSCSTNQTITQIGQQLKWMEGEWRGLGYQPDSFGQKSWSIELDVDLKERTCLVNYPSFPCSGRLELVKADGRSAHFIEKIEEGTNLCYNEGLLILTLVDENHLSYSFFYPDKKQLGSFSTLVRKSYQDSFNKKTL